ncbi:dnaJ-like protein subfamily C member 17-like [Hibiscus syriacus]|uniref:DnaJ-like protein subfamily C member 17-like n=1 Tax=Hibiscus syriacus TaxID=106335 RepID=A0A6A2XB34_HIBSY|nr:uncharacterized protein LOC120171630 [Hibiscus syriacus]KAE8672801.1 dnaJ-like protein subfamily C member 17-like [Hibiscus syriacus]
MASLQISNPVFSSISISQSIFLGNSDSRKRILNFQRCRNLRSLHSQRSRICCATEESDNKSNGEEPTESLFMKELKRRGMTPNSLLEDTKKPRLDEEMKVGEEGGSLSKRNAVSTKFDKSLSNQRERSMELNSEGLEGLIPRAKLLLTLGGTFFLSFWPLILATIAFFSALYIYFGPSFIHDGSTTPVAPPQYIDPYTLLEDERISQTSPNVN